MENKKKEICEKIFELGLMSITRAKRGAVACLSGEGNFEAIMSRVISQWRALCLECAAISDEDFSEFLNSKFPLEPMIVKYPHHSEKAK